MACPLSTRSGPFVSIRIGQQQQGDQHQRVVQTVPERWSAITSARNKAVSLIFVIPAKAGIHSSVFACQAACGKHVR